MTKLTKIVGLTAAALLLAPAPRQWPPTPRSASCSASPARSTRLSPPMWPSANLAAKNINDQGGINGGTGDRSPATTTASPPTWPTPPPTQLINDGAVAIVGGMCSGVTIAIANNVAVPNGVLHDFAVGHRRRPSRRSTTRTSCSARRRPMPTIPKCSPSRCSRSGITERRHHLREQRLRQGPRRQFLGCLHRRRRQGARQRRA